MLTDQKKKNHRDWCKKFLKTFNRGRSRGFKRFTTGDKQSFYNLHPEIRNQGPVDDLLIAGVRKQLKLIPMSAFLECLQKWIHRVEKCAAIGGDYVEKVLKELNNMRNVFRKFSEFVLLPSPRGNGTSLVGLQDNCS